MTTPCEELGYKVGDRFKVVSNKSGVFSIGSLVELYEDDDSRCPLFKLVEGYCEFNNADSCPGAYTAITNMEKISDNVPENKDDECDTFKNALSTLAAKSNCHILVKDGGGYQIWDNVLETEIEIISYEALIDKLHLIIKLRQLEREIGYNF